MSEQTATAGDTFPKLVGGLRDSGVGLVEIGRVTGVQVRQVQHWLAGTSRPQGATLDRLLDLNYVIDRLSDVYTPDGIEVWLRGRNRSLRGERPIEMLEHGDFEPVVNLVEQLTGGTLG